MKKTFDLTSKNGVTALLPFLNNSAALTSSQPSLIDISKSFFGLGSTTEKQRKLIEDIIKTGKEKGVDEMEIIVDNKRELDLKLPSGIGDITFSPRTKSTTVIRVKYK